MDLPHPDTPMTTKTGAVMVLSLAIVDILSGVLHVADSECGVWNLLSVERFLGGPSPVRDVGRVDAVFAGVFAGLQSFVNHELAETGGASSE